VPAVRRTVRASVPISEFPEDWSEVALHLRLTKPKNLEFDSWDRVGSLGLLVGDDQQDANVVRFAAPPKGSRHWLLDPIDKAVNT